MKCLSCDRRLNNRESTRKYASSGTFVDLCDRCFSFVADDIPDVDGEGYDPSDYVEEDEATDDREGLEDFYGFQPEDGSYGE